MAIGSKIQFNPSMLRRFANFYPVGNGIALACTASSGNVALPTLADGSPATDLMIYNSGGVTAFITFGTDNTVAAVIPTGTAANGVAIPPGVVMILSKSTDTTYVAGITGSSTATLYLYPGIGS